MPTRTPASAIVPLRLVKALLPRDNSPRSYLSTHWVNQRSWQRAYFSTQSSGNGNNRQHNQQSAASSTPAALKSVYDRSPHWEDWFSPEEYGNPYEYANSHLASHYLKQSGANKNHKSSWQRSLILENLDGDLALDAASRHLIRSLQTIYMDGYQREVTTTQSCQAIMHRLLQSADDLVQADPKGVDSALQARQRVVRAEAILRTMELFWDWVPDLLDDPYPQKRFVRDASSTSKPAVEWPLPTTYIYSTLLVKLANLRAPKQYQQVNNADIPWRTQDLVLRMHRYHQVKGINYIKKPTVMEWNQALVAWANTHGSRDHPEKSIHATQFFMDMTLDYGVKPDVSSYTHVLRACAHSDQNDKAILLGAKVAIKFWNGVLHDALQEQQIMPTPLLFVFFIRAVSQLPPNDNAQMEMYVEQAFTKACDAGVVNEHVLYEVEQSSRSLFQRLLGQYTKQRTQEEKAKTGKTKAYDKSFHQALLKHLPSDWTLHILGKDVKPDSSSPALFDNFEA